MIPKTIHQIWWQGEDKIPEHLKAYMTSWRTLHPDCKFIVWDETAINNILKSYPDWKKTLDKYPLMIQKIDFAKYVILYLFGGFYIDVDVLCLKPIYPLFNNDLVLSLAPYTLLDRCFAIAAGHDPCHPVINNGIIGAVPLDKRLDVVIKYCRTAQWSLWYWISKPAYIFNTTGPLVFSRALRKAGIKKNALILDSTMFEALNFFDVHTDKKPPEYAYGSHIYEVAWMKGTWAMKIINWYLSKK